MKLSKRKYDVTMSFQGITSEAQEKIQKLYDELAVNFFPSSLSTKSYVD